MPGHSRLLESLREYDLTPRLRHTAADGQPGTPVRAVLHLLAVLEQVVVCLLVLLLFLLGPVLPPVVLRRRVQHANYPTLLVPQPPPHPPRPRLPRLLMAKEHLSQLAHI